MNLFALFKSKRSPQAAAAARRRSSSASPKTGRAARSPLSAHDGSLSTATQAWVQALPAPLRPLELCDAYPRVANRIALCWNDLALSDTVFNELLLDQRGGREGFPAAIAAELLRLHAQHERRVARADAAGSGRPGRPF